jgi:hypothetical protein
MPLLWLGDATCAEHRNGHLVSMRRPNKVEAMPKFRLRISYPDGAEGVIDLSREVGQGVFAPLADEGFFRKVHIGEFGQIAWSEEIEICPDAAYYEITRKAATQTAHA